MACACGLRWDVNDPEPPACPNERRAGPVDRRAPRTLATVDQQIIDLARAHGIAAPSTVSILAFAHAVRSIAARPTIKTAPYRCKYCGAPSWIDPSDQVRPPAYCHESDHGEPDE